MCSTTSSRRTAPIPHATLLTVDGRRHMLEPAFFALLREALSAHVARATRRA
jgi:hypothetical protein